MTLLGVLLDSYVRRPLLVRLVRPVVVFTAIVLGAAVGFSTLDGVGLVDGLFWLLDPGGITTYFQGNDGPERLVKSYAILAFVGILITGLWTVETLLSATFGGQIRDELISMKIEQQIAACDAHVVVCGYGTFGKTIATRLRDDGREVVVIEADDTHYERALDEGLPAVNGDACLADVLGDAGIERAKTVVGAIDNAKLNMQIAVAATQLAPELRLVLRAGNEMDRALAQRLGADEVVIPEIVSGLDVCAHLDE